MGDNNGWIKLHRKIIDSAVFNNPKLLKLWIWCLCKASHKKYKTMVGNQVVKLQEGQFIFGRKVAAYELCMSESKVYRDMKLLENLKMLNIKTNNKFSLITIEKWAFYQGDEADVGQQNEQQMNNKRTTSEQQVNTNKNVKNVKECKEVFSDRPELNKAIISFVDYRKSIHRPMTDDAIRLLIKNLNSMSTSVDEQIAILNQSIANGWCGLLPLKNKKSNTNFKGRVYDFEKLEKELTQN